jgi:hypothetical protein
MNRWHIESGLAALFAALAILTAVVPDWIEAVFGVDPDHGTGYLEWLIVVVAGLIAIVVALAARRDWLRLRATGA